MAESLITSVPNHDEEAHHFPVDDIDDDGLDGQVAIPKILHLDIRGTRRDLDRETVIMMPESLLITLFPNGLVLGPQQDDDDDDDESIGGRSNDQVYVTPVDFDLQCLEFVLDFFKRAQLEGRSTSQAQEPEDGHGDQATMMPTPFQPLEKQRIIFLREELEYFCIPSQPKLSASDMTQLKQLAGQHLEQQSAIFEALQKSIARENNLAEQHLIDMLCDAGFSSDACWGYRALQPKTTCIVSIGLVHIKATGADHHMAATAQKLMLFWRKPARKCWWDGSTANLQGQAVRLWARRTWTLELALV